MNLSSVVKILRQHEVFAVHNNRVSAVSVCTCIVDYLLHVLDYTVHVNLIHVHVHVFL